jgi:small-conductance mechanosensitive channel
MEENLGMFDALIRFGAVALLTVGAYWLTRLLLARFALPLLRRSQPKWAAPVERSRLPMLTALLAAVITLGLAASVLTDAYSQINNLVRVLDVAAGIGLLAYLLVTAASVALAIYEQMPLAKDVPLRGFTQLVQGGLFLIGALMIVATLLGVPAIYSFTALAALFAAMGFVFQDPIMGFVAGIQLAANKMVAIGDWIEVPQYGANGAVQEILMSTVKVQNWDNTVTTVPTRSLISESFKNWRPMQASGGRRMQRTVMLDVFSVRLLTPELLARYPVLAETRRQIDAGDLGRRRRPASRRRHTTDQSGRLSRLHDRLSAAPSAGQPEHDAHRASARRQRRGSAAGDLLLPARYWVGRLRDDGRFDGRACLCHPAALWAAPCAAPDECGYRRSTAHDAVNVQLLCLFPTLLQRAQHPGQSTGQSANQL